MLCVLVEELEKFDGTIDPENLAVVCFAEAAVLLFVSHLLQEDGFTNDQTVYPYALGFEPADFLAVQPRVGSGLEAEYDFELIRLGSAAMLLADIKDEMSEDSVLTDTVAGGRRHLADAILEHSLSSQRPLDRAVISSILREFRRPPSSRDYVGLAADFAKIHASVRQMMESRRDVLPE